MFNWLSSLFSRQEKAGFRPAPHIQPVAVHQGYAMGNTLEGRDPAGVYASSSWVYLAVNRITEAAALVPSQVYRLDGEQRVAIERHPVEDLLDAPNPFMSRFELIEQTVGMLELTGNAYWFLAGDGRGQPSQIWTLRPDRVTIVPDPVNFVRGYVYEIDGQRIPLEAREVIHFKRWHPANDFYGLSALEAARLTISSDRAMAQWNHNTFGRDNGVPAGIVNIKEHISDSDFERIKREWRQSYGGPQRKTAFLRGGNVEWHNLGLSHTDLDFLQGRRAHRDEILNIFGIPVGLISDNATEANAKVAERTFIERTLYPKLMRISQKISQELLPFYAGEHIFTFEDIRPTDAQARLNEIKTAYPVLSINEIRTRYYQLSPVEWGEHPVNHDAPPLPETSTDENGADDSAPTPDAIKTELARWEKFTLKRLSQPDHRPFEVTVVPDDLAFEIRAGLLSAGEDSGAVKAVFHDARAQMVITE